MNASPPPVEAVREPLCVPFNDAVLWMACRDPAAWSLEPLPLSAVFARHKDKEALGPTRFDRAINLLLIHAARGKVKLYARSFSSGDLSSSGDFSCERLHVPLDPAFIAKASYLEQHDGKYSALCVLEEEGRGWADDLAVDHHDLTVVAPAPPRRFDSRKRGRPPEYDWPSFLAEALGRCLAGQIARQVELEAQMAQWCSEHWDKEPSPSQVRDYAGAALRAVEAYRQGE